MTDGDVVGASPGRFRITPLPDKPQGEAIAYTPDGRYFLTVSDALDHPEDVVPVILRYTPTEPAPEPTSTPEAQAPAPAERSRSLLDRLGPQGILNIVAAIGVVGLLTGDHGDRGHRPGRVGPPPASRTTGSRTATGRHRRPRRPPAGPGSRRPTRNPAGSPTSGPPGVRRAGGAVRRAPPGRAAGHGTARGAAEIQRDRLHGGVEQPGGSGFDQDHPDGYPDDRAAYPNRQDGTTPPGCLPGTVGRVSRRHVHRRRLPVQSGRRARLLLRRPGLPVRVPRARHLVRRRSATAVDPARDRGRPGA